MAEKTEITKDNFFLFLIYFSIPSVSILIGNYFFNYFSFIESIIILIFFESLIFISMVVLYIIGKYNLRKNTIIREDMYYSPGLIKSKSELKINDKCIFLKLSKMKPNGKINSMGKKESILYKEIKSIRAKDFRIFIKKPEIITGLEIKTKNNKIGFIDFGEHNKDEIYRLLNKYLKNQWESIYQNECLN